MGQGYKISRPTSHDHPSLGTTLPKQHHLLETESSNTGAYGATSPIQMATASIEFGTKVFPLAMGRQEQERPNGKIGQLEVTSRREIMVKAITTSPWQK